jgi:hypothetical protein
MIHGLAGLAAFCGLIPITNQGSTWFDLAYLTLFSLGVLTAMTVFGGLFVVFFRQLNLKAFRMAVAIRVLSLLATSY